MADFQEEDEFRRPELAVRTARQAAYVALEEGRNSGNWLSDLLDRIFRSASLPPRERGLATELALGTVRRIATLDAVLSTLVKRPLDQVEPPLLTLLRLGVYQVLLLDGVPPHASVHETVELGKWLGKLRWSGFVNGVLRSATRLARQEFSTEPAASHVPVAAGRYRVLAEPLFPDPKADPIGYLRDAFSFPHWLAERWSRRYDAHTLLRLGGWFNTPAALTLRVNRLRATLPELRERLVAAGVAVRSLESMDALALEQAAQIPNLPGYGEGWFAVQDLSAIRAALALAPRPGQSVWDVCAAPGGKTCLLAEQMQNTGSIVATDIRAPRLDLVEDNCQRLGITNVTTQLIGEHGEDLPAGPFDAILVDVPCSNTGVLGKRPEARWRITPAGITELNRVQERLLRAGLQRLAPGGRLVYSTCSIEPEENQLLVARVCGGRADLTVVREAESLPGDPADGGFLAVIEQHH